MTAEEARKKAISSVIQFEYNNVMHIVEQAASRGEMFVWFNGFISTNVVEKLKNDGYKVGNSQMDRNEVITKISWLP